MIKIGTTLTLEQRNKEDEVTRFKCRIVEHQGHTLYIDYPINVQSGRTDVFPKGTTFEAFYVGEQEAVFHFSTEIKGRKKANLPMLLLHFDEKKMKKIQRREYVRVDANIDIALEDQGMEIPSFSTLTSDISGGGVAVNLKDGIKVKPGTTFKTVLVLRTGPTEYHYIYATTEAIRTQQKKDHRTATLSMKFTDIDEKDRQKIIQYCFETQLKNRRQTNR
ncbi:c-di-GMP-binding flagellar brake protein YcgR [Streptohalobacillus salinus]|uniref:C-di-GMP-binding flagellar brake protein YcgR n=1 Tax=Streptohalobacillus salinus TaxID=621096 RepID=A0A2V3WHC4_9BACI|nr:flagellar brake domain-containing protein [Streptohalobacillus salinus]PXW91715.1 c-di-GMP-binding flagellar brake protein YcgR [Streptohalobacillus salinus]